MKITKNIENACVFNFDGEGKIGRMYTDLDDKAPLYLSVYMNLYISGAKLVMTNLYDEKCTTGEHLTYWIFQNDGSIFMHPI